MMSCSVVHADADVTRRGHAHVAAGGLDEAHPAVADLRLLLDDRVLHGREAELLGAEPDAGDADDPAAAVALTHDPLAVHLDERLELVRLAERVSFP